MIGGAHPVPAFKAHLDTWAAKLDEAADRLDQCEHLAASGEPGVVPLYAPERVLCRACAVDSIHTRARMGVDECDECGAPAATVYLHRLDDTGRSMAVTLCTEHLRAGFRREVRA